MCLSATLLSHLAEEAEIVRILKELKGHELLVQQLDKTEHEEVKLILWHCFKVLTKLEHDLLVDFRKLRLINILLEELEISTKPLYTTAIIEILTNLSMNDQNAIFIRL